MNQVQYIINLTSIPTKSIENTLQLLHEGATVPFISRYRKEATNGLDEVQITAIRDFSKKFDELIARQQTIINAIEEQDKLTAELKSKIEDCFDAALLEDLYLPFKQKRQTKGDKAKKLGLEPLAKMIMAQRGGDPFQMAERFVKGEVVDEEMALSGANDIIAEWINENASSRARLRQMFQRKAIIHAKLVKGKEELAEKYRDYFDFTEALHKCASHRFLALYRAEREGLLSLKAQPEQEEALEFLERFYVKGNDACSELVKTATKDAYKRLLAPSLENEVLQEAKEKADLADIEKLIGKKVPVIAEHPYPMQQFHANKDLLEHHCNKIALV